jgi:pimeloyl-ACP methyl ester carboxylesterase
MDATSPPPADRVPIDDDRHVAYAEYGDPAGHPVVFFHGTPGTCRLGRLFDTPARREGVRVLAVDRPGYGGSSPWPTRDLTDTDAFVRPVLDDAGVDRAGVVGFSGGGPHALAFAATCGDCVTSVDVVAGAAPSPTPPAQRLLGRLASTTPRLLSGLFRAQAWLATRVSPAVVVSQYTSATGRIPDEVATLVARDFADAVGGARRGAVTELRLLAAPWELPLATVDSPVRLWHGTHDANVPLEGARALRDRLPDARLHTVEDADHLRSLLRSRDRILTRHAR